MTELVKVDGDDLKKEAVSLAKSDLIPQALKRKPEDIWIIIRTGQELGMGPMKSLRSIHIVQGRPVISAELIVGLCVNSPLCRFFRVVESTSEIATYETLRVGHPEPTRLSFTIKQAAQAQLAGRPTWKLYPDAMLRARCKSALAREVYPDLVMGIYASEEELVPTEQATKIHDLKAQVMNDEGEENVD